MTAQERRMELLKEYELTQSAYYQNEHSILQFSSILLAGVFVLIGGALASALASKLSIIFPSASLLIIISMVVWRLHAERISSVGRARSERLMELELLLDFKQHHYAEAAKHGISIRMASWIFVGSIVAILLFLNFALWSGNLKKITENKETVMISIWWIILPIGIMCGTILLGIVLTRLLIPKDVKKTLKELGERVTQLEQDLQRYTERN